MNKDYYIKLQAKIDDDGKALSNLNKQIDDMSKKTKELEIRLNTESLDTSTKKVKGEFSTLEDALKKVGLTTETFNKEFTESKTRLDSAEKTVIRYKNSLGQQLDITTKMDNETKSYSASLVKLNNDLAKNVNTTANLNAQYKSRGEVFKQLGADMKDFKMSSQTIGTGGDSTQTWIDSAGKVITLNGKMIDGQTKYKGTLKEVNTAVAENAKQADKWYYSWSKAFQSFTTYMSVTTVFYQSLHAIQNMVGVIVDLDAALVELQKVTTLEGSALEEFTRQAYQAGERVAKTGEEMVEAATSFAKAGYNETLSLQLGEVAAMYTNIADEEIKVADAADMIIAQMKAFNMDETEETAMRVIDVINEVSNNFAVSSADIANNLGKASAVMANAGNSFEQMVAVMVAGTEVTRSATKVANGLKTITLRLQGMNDEGEKDLELVAQMEELYSKLGITVYNTDGTLKNTYDLLGALASVYGDLTAAEKAYVTEAIAGKYQAQNAAAILSNWDSAARALETGLGSMGSAATENEKVINSIQGRLQALNSQFEMLASNLIDSDLVKGIINLGVAFLKAANSGIGQFIIKGGAITGVIVLMIKLLSALEVRVGLLNAGLGLNARAIITNTLAQAGLTSATQKSIVSILAEKGAFDKETGSISANTIKKIENKLATEGMTKAQQKEVIGKLSLVGANGAATTSFKALTAAALESAAALLTNPITWIVAGLAAVGVAIYAVATATDRAYDKAKESYEKAKNELDSVKNELDEIQSKIDELNSKETLTVVEYEQLELLKSQNELLKERAKILEEEANIEEKKMQKAAAKKAEKTAGGKDGYTRTGKATYDVAQGTLTPADGKTKSISVEDDIKNIREGQKQIEAFQKDIERVNESLIDEETKVCKYSEEANKEIEDYQNQIKETEESMAESKKALKKQAEAYLEASKTEGLSIEEKLYWYQKYLDIMQVIDEKGYTKIKMGSLFDSDTMGDSARDFAEGLTKLSEEENLNAESIQELIDKYPEIKEYMEENGITAQDLADNWGAISEKAEEVSNNLISADSAISTFSKTMSDLQTQYSDLASVVDDFNEKGYLTVDAFNTIIDSGLMQYLEFTENGLVANANALISSGDAAKYKALMDLQAAFAQDAYAIATGDMSNASSIAKGVVAGLGDKIDVAGTIAEAASGKMFKFGAAIAAVKKAAEKRAKPLILMPKLKISFKS